MPTRASARGRWPTNLLLGHAPECRPRRCAIECLIAALGSRARFFHCAKADRRERDAGCEHLRRRTTQTLAIGREADRKAAAHLVANHHATVTQLELLRWLVRLATATDGLGVDPFCGTGSTGCAAVLKGMRFIGIERDPEYVAIARARIHHWADVPVDPALAPSGDPPAPRSSRTTKARGQR